jgi:hypothetical protein
MTTFPATFPATFPGTAGGGGGPFSWSGYTWTPLDGVSAPGPNTFDSDLVAVNGAGQLVLEISDRLGGWRCAQVQGPHLGYGKYTWTISSAVHDYDRNLVLGLFTYDNTAGPYFREIDLEISQFGNATSERGWCNLQPGGAGKQFWFNPRSDGPHTFSFTWAAGKLRWEVATAGRVVESFLTTTAVPTPGTATPVLMNFWLFGGNAPVDGLDRTAIFDSFTFTAAAPVADRAPTLHLVDDFPYGSLTSVAVPAAGGRWNNLFGSPAPSIVNGRARLQLATGAAAYTGIGSGPQSDPTRQFDLTGSEVSVRWHTYPNTGNGTTEAALEVKVDPDTNQNTIGIVKRGSTLALRYAAGGVASETTTAFVAGLMDWWRIRAAGGLVYWETSANGAAWAALRVAANPITITAVYPYIFAGHYGAETNPGTAEFDNVNEPSMEVGVPSGYPYLGYGGTLTQLPSPAPGYEPADILRGGTHELLGGGHVRDRIGSRRRFTLNWVALSDDNWSLVRTLARLPGPYRYLDPTERNLLTTNQSTGTDELRTTDGIRAVNQGTITSDSTQARSGVRSLAWATGTALAATGRGVAFSNPSVDVSWAAVRPSVAYSFQVWAHASAAVTMQAQIDWYTAAGAYISTSTGTAASVATGAGAWTQLTAANKTSPPTAAYGIGGSTNTATTGAAVTVWFDDPQQEEGATATTWRLGAGTPLVAVDSVTSSIPMADGTAGYALHAVELVLLEL